MLVGMTLMRENKIVNGDDFGLFVGKNRLLGLRKFFFSHLIVFLINFEFFS